MPEKFSPTSLKNPISNNSGHFRKRRLFVNADLPPFATNHPNGLPATARVNG
jgi:hypothetical protein